jgi:hypothetical protein
MQAARQKKEVRQFNRARAAQQGIRVMGRRFMSCFKPINLLLAGF